MRNGVFRGRIVLPLLILGFTPQVWGQQPIEVLPPLPAPPGVIDFGIQNMRAQQACTEQQQDAMRAMSKRCLAVHIDQFDRVCQLSDAQRKKLEVAAKGAVAGFIEKWAEQMQNANGNAGSYAEPRVVAEPVFQQLNGDVGLAVVPPPIVHPQPAVEAPPAIAPAPVAPLAVAPDLGRAPFVLVAATNPSDVKAEPIWTAAVKNTLSREQLQAYREAFTEHDRFRRQSAANLFVAALDTELLLSGEQRKQLAQVALDVLGDQLLGNFNLANNFVGITIWDLARQIPQEFLKGVLGEAQLGRWNDLMSDGPPAQWMALPRPVFAAPPAPMPPAAPAIAVPR